MSYIIDQNGVLKEVRQVLVAPKQSCKRYSHKRVIEIVRQVSLHLDDKVILNSHFIK